MAVRPALSHGPVTGPPGAFLEDVGDDLRAAAAGARLELEHALCGLFADDLHVRFRNPHARRHAVHRNAVTDRFAERGGLTDARAPEHDPVRLGAPHLRPNRGLIVAGRRIWESLERVAQL